MLEHVPHWLGHALRGLRAGADKLCIVQPELGGAFAAIHLSSPAFGDGARLPPRFTADGEGVSPPLVWGPLPEGTQSLALIVEDPDAPSPQPLVHAILCGLPPTEHRLAEGAIRADGDGSRTGGMSAATRFSAKAGCRPIRRPAMARTVTPSSFSPCPASPTPATLRAAPLWSRP